MRHGQKKIKFQLGKDANKMLLRKLSVNFLKVGKITTTQSKARILKSYMEKLVEKMKKETEANRNYLLSKLADVSLIKSLYKNVGPVMSKRIGGYLKSTKLYERDSDGALMTRLEWVEPIIKEEVKKI